MRHLFVDASHLAHRCRYAEVGALTRKDGTPSGVVYGFLRGLAWARNKVGTDLRETVLFWDGGRSSYRLQLLPTYKDRCVPTTQEEIAAREAFYAQTAAIREGLAYRGVRSILVRHTEADDLIALATHSVVAAGDDVVVFTGDKDMQQLLCNQVTVFHPTKEVIDEQRALTELGLRSISEIVRFLAIDGDDSDNIRGVPGLGPKRTLQVLPCWEHIWTDEPKPDGVLGGTWKWVEAARQHRDVIQRNLALVQLPKTWQESYYGVDVSLAVIEQMKNTPQPDLAKFVGWCREWELEQLDLSHW